MRSALVAWLLLVLSAGSASAHTRLERSTPAAGDTLTVSPAELRLVFSQRVAERYTTLTLYSPSGDVIPTGSLRSESAGRAYFVAAPALTRSGEYRIEWKTTAADGHVITGTIAFTLVLAADTLAGDTLAAPAGASGGEQTERHEHHADPALMPPLLRPGSWLNVLARTLQFASLLLIIGLAAFRSVLLPHVDAEPAARDALRRNLRQYGAIVLTVFLLTLPLRLWLQSAALHGPELATQPQLVGSMLLELNWGRAWLVQLGAAAFAAIAILTGFTPLLAPAALALTVTPAFQGHAASAEPAALAIAADGLHVLAAGVWIGTLAAMIGVAVPTLWREQGNGRELQIARLVNRFSPLALTGAATLALAGLGSALFHLRAPLLLVTTAYGRALFFKLLIVALVAGAGWYNWQRTRPSLEQDAGVAALRRAATLELAFAAAAVIATAILVALPTP